MMLEDDNEELMTTVSLHLFFSVSIFLQFIFIYFLQKGDSDIITLLLQENIGSLPLVERIGSIIVDPIVHSYNENTRLHR